MAYGLEMFGKCAAYSRSVLLFYLYTGMADIQMHGWRTRYFQIYGSFGTPILRPIQLSTVDTLKFIDVFLHMQN